jgi:gliding motility-associated-like protein
MSKINTFLAAIGMVFLAFSANAQLTFTFVPSNSTPALGETITVDVVVTGFTDIALYQYSINWNQNLLSYQGLSNLNLPGLSVGGSFGTTQTSNGILTTSWSDPGGGVTSVPDGTVIYTITYDVVASSGATTDIMFTGTPVGFEIYQGLGLNDITNSVVFNDATIVIDGGGSGGLECNFMGFGVTVTSDSAATGDQVCLDVAVCNFSEIVSLQYTTQFDPNKLQFDNVTNFGGLENLSAGNFGTNNAGNGFITLSWFDTLGAGVTVADETVIYSICFTAIGAGGEMDDVLINGALSPIEVTDANSGGSNIGLESIDGVVTITGTSGSAVTIIASQESGNPGDTVTVDISVKNFDSIASLQASMLWDPAIISFFETQNPNTLPGTITFNTSPGLTNAGKLTFSWNDPGATGINLNDDEIIFSIRYVIVGNITDISAVDFTNDPTSIEVSQSVDGSLETVPLAKIPGLVEVIGAGVLTINVGTITGCTGDTICVPISPENYNEIVSMQYDIIWNDTELDFINVQDFNLSGLNTSNFNPIGNSKVRLSWVEPTLDPQTVLDGEVLYSMCFEVLSADGTTPDISFDQGATIEFTEGAGANPVPSYVVNDGGINVDCTPPGTMEVSDTLITNVLCKGDATGSIDITIINSVGTVDYLWSNGATTQDISGVFANSYTVTITDDNTTLIEMYVITEPATSLGVAMSSTDATTNGGNDGTATATPSGGTSTYSYAWSAPGGTTSTITGLSAGTYTVTVTDANGCTVTDQVDVDEPPLISVTISGTDVTCNGEDDGTATVTPSGGLMPYSYTWSPNVGSTAIVTGLAPDTYNVTVTDTNGATTTASVIINEPAVLTLNVVDDNVTCFGADNGTATAIPGGGTPGYTYLWDDGGSTTNMITGLAPGQYEVTVTDDNGCTEVGSTFVSEPDELTASAVVSQESCNDENDGSIDITPSGGTPGYTYDWGDGTTTQDRTGLTPGVYTVTITDAFDCTVIETNTIIEATPINIVIDGQSNILCNGDNNGSINITSSGGTGPYTYNWGGGISDEDPTGLSEGIYTLTITDDNGCTQIGAPVTITEPAPLSITVVSTTNIICNGDATGAIDIDVFGGTSPYAYDWGFSNNQDLTGLFAGTYTPTITDDNGCVLIGSPITILEEVALTVSSSTTSVSCNGEEDGTISLTVAGGVPNYSYNWNPAVPFPNQGNQTGVSAGTYFVTITDDVGCTTVRGPIAVTQPAVLELSSNVTNATASNDDGMINLTVTGGTPNYSFEWSNGATTEDLNGLSSGCYVVTVEDSNGCSVIDSIKVGGIIVISGVVSDVSCAGSCDGGIDITALGGIPPYTYTWSGTGVVTISQDQTNLCAGNYTVTVEDSNGSLTSQNFVVGSPTALTISSSIITDETGNGCNGGVNITVTGGTQPYTYQWSNGQTSQDISNVCKGDYDVTIIDANGCILISNTFTVAPPPLVVAMTDINMASCDGSADGSVCIYVLGGCGPYTLTLNGNSVITVSGENVCFDDLAAGNYIIAITDSGIPQLDIDYGFTITDPEPISITLLSSNNNTDPTGNNCNGSIDIDVSGGVGNYSYLWSNGAMSEDIDNVCESPPSYCVTVTDENGCTASLCEVLDLGLSIQVVGTDNVSCFDECDGSIDIQVNGGVLPYTYNWSPSGGTNADPNGLCAGTYTVTVTDGNGLTVSTTVAIDQPANPLTVIVENMIRPTADDANGLISLDVNGGWGFASVSWSGPNGFTASTLTVGGLVEGFYTATVIDANGCIEVITVQLPANRLVLDFEFLEPNCNGDADGQIEILVSGGSGPYSITWSNGQTGDLAFDLTAGEYSVTVVDTGITGLSASTTVELTEPELLSVALDVTNATGPADGMIEAIVTGGTEPYTYVWSTGENTPKISRLAAGIFGLQVTDAHDCEIIISQIEVILEGECLEARKVISPNNDGKNDELIISCVESFNNNLKIFNRWGQMVYEADNYDNTWSGTGFDNQLLPESGYFWVLEYTENGQEKQTKGAFTLLRGE